MAPSDVSGVSNLYRPPSTRPQRPPSGAGEDGASTGFGALVDEVGGSDSPSSFSGDALKVDMPNGFSVSIVHFGTGSSGFSAQMLASLEQTVSFLNTLSPSQGSAAAAPATGENGRAASDGMDRRVPDTFHAPLGDDNELVLRYGDLPDGGNTNAAAADAMADALEKALGKYRAATASTRTMEPDLASWYDSLTGSTS